MRILLGSGGYSTSERLKHWVQTFDRFLGGIKEVLFVPYALADHDLYVQKMMERNLSAGRKLVGIHKFPDARKAVEQAEAIFVGGGNSFRLLNELYRNELVSLIGERVRAGLPYIGVSAGTNMAGPTMKTTNDMPIVQPPSLDAIGLVPFQINPHYFSGAIYIKGGSEFISYGGETRDDRIREFHEMNLAPVVGLGEGTHLTIENQEIVLSGSGGFKSRLFRRGEPPRELPQGQDLVSAGFLSV